MTEIETLKGELLAAVAAANSYHDLVALEAVRLDALWQKRAFFVYRFSLKHLALEMEPELGSQANRPGT